MADLTAALAHGRVRDLKKQRLRLEQEEASIRDRVRDLEWKAQWLEDGFSEDLESERQRALDKLRQVCKELLAVKESLVDVGVV